MADSAVTLESRQRRYGKRRAARRVGRFPKGAVGLLGPNGAGKSTMLKRCSGSLPPKTGRLQVLGLNVAERPLEVRRAWATCRRMTATFRA
jgi:ABC-2 type transport system ATP-binding protein